MANCTCERSFSMINLFYSIHSFNLSLIQGYTCLWAIVEWHIVHLKGLFPSLFYFIHSFYLSLIQGYSCLLAIVEWHIVHLFYSNWLHTRAHGLFKAIFFSYSALQSFSDLIFTRLLPISLWPFCIAQHCTTKF